MEHQLYYLCFSTCGRYPKHSDTEMRFRWAKGNYHSDY